MKNSNKKKLVIIVVLSILIVIEAMSFFKPKYMAGNFDDKYNYLKTTTTNLYKNLKYNHNDDEAVILASKAKIDSSYAFILQNYAKFPRDLIIKLNANDECKDYVINYLSKTKSHKAVKLGNNVPYLSQYDARWGYEYYGNQMIGINGCGPTSLSMIAMYFNKNPKITPKVVADMAVKRNYYVPYIGSSWALMSEGAQQYGLKSRNIPVTKDNIINALKDGEKIIISVKPGYFTKTGHFMVLKGLNKQGKVLINDPNSLKKSQKSWDVDYIVSQGQTMWCLKKAI